VEATVTAIAQSVELMREQTITLVVIPRIKHVTTISVETTPTRFVILQTTTPDIAATVAVLAVAMVAAVQLPTIIAHFLATPTTQGATAVAVLGTTMFVELTQVPHTIQVVTPVTPEQPIMQGAIAVPLSLEQPIPVTARHAIRL
jgi:hypothetical protein